MHLAMSAKGHKRTFALQQSVSVKGPEPTLTAGPFSVPLRRQGFAGASSMNLPGEPYFYALGALSMAFLGFTSIVVSLHQGADKPFSPFQILITRLFAELGLMATAFAMMAPTLGMWGLNDVVIWRFSSAIMLATLVPWLVTYPLRRRRAAPGQKFPLRGYIMNTLGALTSLALCSNAIGWPMQSGPGALAIAAVFVLSFASVSFFWTYNLFLHE